MVLGLEEGSNNVGESVGFDVMWCSKGITITRHDSQSRKKSNKCSSMQQRLNAERTTIQHFYISIGGICPHPHSNISTRLLVYQSITLPHNKQILDLLNQDWPSMHTNNVRRRTCAAGLTFSTIGNDQSGCGEPCRRSWTRVFDLWSFSILGKKKWRLETNIRLKSELKCDYICSWIRDECA